MELLAAVDLAKYAGIPAVELAYGRKRSLEIATTLAMDPKLMLLDEPTQGMGLEDVERIQHLIKRVAADLGMSKKTLAETFGITPVTLQRKARADATKTQNRLREGLEILNRVSDWAGGQVQAMAWYRAEPIPAFGGRTAESLVKEGKAAAVRDYLDRVALGGFA